MSGRNDGDVLYYREKYFGITKKMHKKVEKEKNIEKKVEKFLGLW